MPEIRIRNRNILKEEEDGRSVSEIQRAREFKISIQCTFLKGTVVGLGS